MVLIMSFKTVTELKAEANTYAQNKTLEVIREEIATKLQNEANEGGKQVEYFNRLAVEKASLDVVTDELNSLGYKAELKENSDYYLLTINW